MVYRVKFVASLMNYCLLLGITQAVITVPILLMMIFIYRWLHLLDESKDCECSDDFRRKYIRWFMLAWIIWILLYAVYVWYQVITKYSCSKFPTFVMNRWVSLVIGILVILYIVFAFQYIKLLKNRDCKCATKGIGDELLTIHASILTAVYALAFLMILIIPIILFLVIRK